MSSSANTLSAQARELPPEERMKLVENILDTLDSSDAAIDTAWAEEAEERLAGMAARGYPRGVAGRHYAQTCASVNLLLLEPAALEMDEAAAWYEAQAVGLGRRFLDEVFTAFERIQRYPDAWHPLSAQTRRFRLNRFP